MPRIILETYRTLPYELGGLDADKPMRFSVPASWLQHWLSSHFKGYSIENFLSAYVSGKAPFSVPPCHSFRFAWGFPHSTLNGGIPHV